MFLLNGKTDKTLEALKTLLLNEYEAKAYFSLLLLGESKPIDVVRASGIPQSRIYWVLDDLKDRKLVEQTQVKPMMLKVVELGVALEQFRSARIEEVRKATNASRYLADLLESLKGVKEKYAGQFRVFEPSGRRK